MPDNVADLQREITTTRERLRSTLHVITSDESINELEGTIRGQAQKVTDDVVAKAREKTENVVSDAIEALKERAVANPLAVLAIGAGLGWKLWKDPPVTTTLVGLGIAGLVANNSLTKRASDSVTDRLGSASEAITKRLDEVADFAERQTEHLKERGQEGWRDTTDFVRDRARDLQNIDINGRNAALLGVAGLAVAAAVGFAIRRSRES
jgi:hypothetical protein